jgi:hypothetical protein
MSFVLSWMPASWLIFSSSVILATMAFARDRGVVAPDAVPTWTAKAAIAMAATAVGTNFRTASS